MTQLGRYRLLEELGRGAMGAVHRAEDPSLGRVVAIKVMQLSSDAFDSAEYEARFYQEAKAAGSLNHPGIITIYDTGREGNWAYIAMELLEGVELRHLMATQRMPLARVLDIAAQVARALEFAHQSGVVHRDIKPANIMVLRDDCAKIMDFGIARMRVSAVETQVGIVLGSPKYMSPEQVVGRRVDHRSDIFSLGVVLFEMAAGIAPFSGKDVGELMHAVVNTPQALPSQFNPAVPEMLNLIVAKALQKDVAARYQSAGEFAADLALCRAALDDMPGPLTEIGDATMPLAVDATVPNPASSREPTKSFVPDGTNGASVTTAAQEPQNTNWADATTVPIQGSAGRTPVSGQLLFSRRFSAVNALARLAQPSVDDAIFLSKAPSPPNRLSTLFATPGNSIAIAMIVAAVLVALVIAFS